MEKTENKKIKGKIGITLVALVVTVVVLIILAGVSLSLVLNNGSVLRGAKDGGKEYINASKNELATLDSYDQFVEDQTTTPPIPEEFYYVGGTTNTGYVISDNISDANKGDTAEPIPISRKPICMDTSIRFKCNV